MAFMDALRAAALLALRLGMCGACWVWACPPCGRVPSVLARRLWRGACAVALGLLVNALVTLTLCGLGHYRPVAEWVTLLLAAMLGVAGGLRSDARAWWSAAMDSLPAGAALLAGLVIVLQLPDRGEWIVGGWDPGVYAGQAAALERYGTLHPPDKMFHEALLPGEQEVFTRADLARTERFPGVTVDSARRAFGFQFFRLTPAVFAFHGRCGGMPVLLRANLVLGLVSVLLLVALLACASGVGHALFALAFFVSCPIWLYHTHVPVSEMLQLCLLLVVFLFLQMDRASPYRPLLLSLSLLATVLNRFSFLAFAGMLLVCLAWMELERPDRVRTLAERCLQAAAIGAAGLLDAVLAPVSIAGWDQTTAIVAAGGGFVAVALGLEIVALRPGWRRRLCPLPGWVTRSGLCLAASAFVLLATPLMTGRDNRNADNLLMLLPHMGWPGVLLALPGAWLAYASRRPLSRVLRGALVFLLAATGVILVSKHCADLYPWATRRHLPLTVLPAAVLAALPSVRLWRSRRLRPIARLAAIGIAVLAVGLNARRAWHAWRNTEYNGVGRLLAQVAARVGPGDVLVADHPKWGMPLSLVYDRPVLNGRPLWRLSTRWEDAIHDPDPEVRAFRELYWGRTRTLQRCRRGMAALERLAGNGAGVYFMTTTEKGMAIYPEPPATRKIWSSPPTELAEIVHHPRGRNYVLRARRRVFTLHALQTAAVPASPATGSLPVRPRKEPRTASGNDRGQTVPPSGAPPPGP